ncbi:helix-turn-helix domain-containing protein [Bradyrhizobium sp. 44]|uniref:helix-turn-helix domain-containing protein n=1 Tax=unclassified Bradyrhizobium TaxID=2631580 RepID=UPI001FFAD262|nr:MULTISPECIES: helix-turn-helix domain-containing protein [unclassified Bradyrhizobium]MCK1288629.1 helix-turn-helix domain-containing protein [Bradyrhizobium sp. 44]UPJ44087.1 helix-turn-helix domain-containing protein [Bradyrhizobium sp. 40]
MTIRYLPSPPTDVSSGWTIRTWHDLVVEAEAIALAELDSPLAISALCGALAVSERTLRKAFHNVHGVPPCRHLRMQRLLQARRALLSSDSNLTTVTEVATCYGFAELGRFSVEYRRIFGESPSETLQRTSQAEASKSPQAPKDSTSPRRYRPVVVAHPAFN